MADYGWALSALKDGAAVRRRGWNGKGMWLAIVSNASCYLFDDKHVRLEAFIVMKTADDKYVPWVCSQTDALADDWELGAAEGA